MWQDSAEQMPNTILAIRRRLQARLALHAQLVNLETATSTRYVLHFTLFKYDEK